MKNLLRSICLLLSLSLSFASIAADEKLGVSSQHPAASPNWLEVAFAADFDGPSRIWVSSLDGNRLRKISSLASSASSTSDTQPTWSPDGRKIAYASSNGSTSDIWVVQSDGAHPERLTANGANN